MIFPDDPFKDIWDMFIAVILIFTCLITPYRIALVDEDTTVWQITTFTVDAFFLLDILVIFNSAFLDDNFITIQSRKLIANNYIKGWFMIDIFAIIPFDYLVGGSDISELVRITRIGKMYKLVKLTRLLRIAKIVKDKSKFAKYLQSFFNIGFGM